MSRLAQEDRDRAIGLYQAGTSQRRIALMLGVHVSTITRLVQCYNTTVSTRDRPRPGQPWITTPRQDCQIVCHHLRDRFLSATESARNVIGKRGGPVTIAQRLRERRKRCRRPYNGNILTQRRRAARVQWAGQMFATGSPILDQRDLL